MKRMVLALLLLAAFGAAADDGDGIKWLGTVHDFGAFSEDNERIKAYFNFVNVGAEPVAITQVAATCGCTVPKYSSDPIAPGDTATIEVTYNPIGRPGKFDKQVYVRTTASAERYRLTIKGVVIGAPATIKGRYPVDMGALKLRNGAVMLGRVAAGHAKSEFIDAYNQSADSLRLHFAQVPSYLRVSSTPEVVPPGEMVNLNFFFMGDQVDQWGIITDSIQVSPDGREYYTLPVVAIVDEDFSSLTPQQLAEAPAMQLESDRIDLGDVPEHSTEPITVQVRLSNRGKSPLIVRRTYSQDPGVEAQVQPTTIAPGKSSTLTVTYDPSQQPTGVIDTRLTLIVNDPAAPTRTLRLVGLRKK